MAVELSEYWNYIHVAIESDAQAKGTYYSQAVGKHTFVENTLADL